MLGSHLISCKDTWYYMRSGSKLEEKNVVSESTKMKASTKIDDDLRTALTSDEGFMRAGAMPSVPTASKSGCKKLMDAMAKAIGKLQ